MSDMNRDDRRKMRVMLKEVEDLIGRVEELSGDLDDRLDNVREHFPDSPREGELEEQMEHLDNSVWMGLDETKTAMEEFLELWS